MSVPKNVESFGKIFIKKRGASEYEQLKSASFSNLDLKWYDLTGDVHSLYEKFLGNRLLLGCSLNNMNSDGKMEMFEGKFLVPLNLGEFSGPDIQYIELAKKMEWELVKEFGLITGEEGDDMTELFRKYQGVSAFCLPERKLLLETPLPAYIGIVGVADDMLDEMGGTDGGLASSRRQMRYQPLKNIFQSPMNALLGHNENASPSAWDDVDFTQMFQMPNIGLHDMLQLRRMYRCSWEITRNVRQEVLKLTTEQDAKPFFECIVDAYKATVMEGCKEWNERDVELFKEAQQQFKNYVNGNTVWLEVSAVLLRIELSDEIRSSWLFKWYIDEVSNHGRKLNDFLSYNKEMMQNDAEENQVYVKHVLEKVPLNEALEKVTEEANKSLRRIISCGKILLEMHENDGELKKYIDMTEACTSVGFLAVGHMSRYHDNLVWDCYVDENE